MNANWMPALSTCDQAIVPCQCETSTPSAYASVEAANAATVVPRTTTVRLIRRATAKVWSNKGLLRAFEGSRSDPVLVRQANPK